jgi:hypothetical protein
MISLFAQATGTPNSGASNAEDFQPLTRNPQTTGGGLQPGTGSQSTGGQDILSNENARIVVPVGEGQAPAPQSTTPGGGINWLVVVGVAVVIVAALEYIFRRRDKRKAVAPAVDTSPQEIVTLPIEPNEPEAIQPIPVETNEKPASKPQAKKASAKTTPKRKTKSKSKRKKSRK